MTTFTGRIVSQTGRYCPEGSEDVTQSWSPSRQRCRHGGVGGKWWPHGLEPWRQEVAALASPCPGAALGRQLPGGDVGDPGPSQAGDATPAAMGSSSQSSRSAYALALTLSVQPLVSFTFFFSPSLSSSVAFTPNTKVGLSLTQLLVYPPC